jgi:hypothetical protein
LRRREGRDPVTNYRSTRKSNFELATAETFARKRKRPPPLAYPFPNKRCIEHTTEVETFGRAGVFGSQNPPLQVRATFFVRPVRRGSRAYMGGSLGCQTLNCRCFTEGWRPPENPSNLLYCCAASGFPASICRDSQ